MAASYGISPIEAGFEVIGLVNCKLIMDYLFSDTRFGQMIIMAGCLIAFVQSYKKFDFSFLFNYFIMSLVLWFLFIKPVIGLGDTTSTMEKEGWKQTTTQDILENMGEDGKVTEGGSLGLVYLSRGFNAIVQGTIKAITKASGKEEMSYLKNPFIVNKVAAHLKSFTANGVTKDRILGYEIKNFLRNCYLPTLMILAQDSGPEGLKNNWWPGHKDIVARYCDECDDDCAVKWNGGMLKIGKETKGINEGLNEYIKKNTEGVWWVGDKIWNMTGPGKTVLKIKLLEAEKEKTAQDIMSNLGVGSDMFGRKFEGIRKKIFGLVGFAGAFVGQGFTTSAAMALIKMLPHIQGWGCLIAYSLFPFTLIICFIWRKASPLVEYFTTLFWLKCWVIVWAIIHYGSIYMAEMQGKMATGTMSDWFFEHPYFNIVTSVFLIMSPAISWFFVKGVLSGIGEIATATTLHTDKGIGKTGI